MHLLVTAEFFSSQVHGSETCYMLSQVFDSGCASGLENTSYSRFMKHLCGPKYLLHTWRLHSCAPAVYLSENILLRYQSSYRNSCKQQIFGGGNWEQKNIYINISNPHEATVFCYFPTDTWISMHMIKDVCLTHSHGPTTNSQRENVWMNRRPYCINAGLLQVLRVPVEGFVFLNAAGRCM